MVQMLIVLNAMVQVFNRQAGVDMGAAKDASICYTERSALE